MNRGVKLEEEVRVMMTMIMMMMMMRSVMMMITIAQHTQAKSLPPYSYQSIQNMP